ncbi:MAG: DUF1566 domain-containing protein [Comamonadaceae bacterium]|nr:DUF1566 domain-containing protein [Comamonadaceae bacterium]
MKTLLTLAQDMQALANFNESNLQPLSARAMKPTERTVLPAKPCRRGVYSAALALSLALPAWAAAPFTVNGNGTVTDVTTGLVWAQCIVGRTGSDCLTITGSSDFDWAEALAAAVAANAASYKGFTDWRVPNVNELESITKLGNYTFGQSTIDTVAFPNTSINIDGGTWTSTSLSEDQSLAWVVYFILGTVDYNYKTIPYSVRLVRGGQSLASFDLLDTTPPATTAGPAVSSAPTTSTAGISVTINEAGTGYWLLVPSWAAAPTPEQVVAGVNYGAVAVVASGQPAHVGSHPGQHQSDRSDGGYRLQAVLCGKRCVKQPAKLCGKCGSHDGCSSRYNATRHHRRPGCQQWPYHRHRRHQRDDQRSRHRLLAAGAKHGSRTHTRAGGGRGQLRCRRRGRFGQPAHVGSHPGQHQSDRSDGGYRLQAELCCPGLGQ